MSTIRKVGIWVHGLASAMITGISTSIAASIVAPESFNIQDGLPAMIQLGIVSGIIGAANYLKQSPLPPVK